MIIDYTYFKSDIQIPNLDKTWVLENLNNFITEYEKTILVDLLGYDLYKKFIEGVEANEQIYLDLRDGKEYTVEYSGSDYTVKWAGLKNDEKISLLAYFTYFYLVRDNQIPLTGTGTVINANDNSKVVSPVDKLSNAWNKGVELYGIKAGNVIREKVIINGLTYFQPTLKHYISTSAYNFLYWNKEDYPTWIFTEKSFINKFGL